MASPLARAWREGFLAATRVLLRFGVPLDVRVDVFNLVVQSGVWLMFQPTRSLYGAYETVDEASGIIVNSQHPASLQRFTAAHELGHHVLKHGATLDGSQQIESAPDSLKERAAQGFAANLLMPLPLVNRTLASRELPRRPTNLTGVQAYQMAIEMGVSYRALITQLISLGKLARGAGGQLLRHQPGEWKRELTGPSSASLRADVWLVDHPTDDRTIWPQIEDEVHLRFPERPSTGFRWEFAHGTALQVLGDNHEPDMTLIGAPGIRHYAVQVKESGTHRIHGALRRPWESQPSGVVSVSVEAEAMPTGDQRHGLAEIQRQALAVG